MIGSFQVFFHFLIFFLYLGKFKLTRQCNKNKALTPGAEVRLQVRLQVRLPSHKQVLE